MKLSNLRADYVSLILCFTVALVTIAAIYLCPSKSNVTEEPEPYHEVHDLKDFNNGIVCCVNVHCPESPYYNATTDEEIDLITRLILSDFDWDKLCDRCKEFCEVGCNDPDCIGTDYHIEVCLNDTL